MKKILAILATIILSCVAVFGLVGCKGSGKQKLNVYTNAGFAPYEYVNEYGEVVGVDIDIMKEIGECLGYEVVINDIDFDQILTEVGKDKFAVGAAGMTKKAERDEAALASNIYATSVQYVIAQKGSLDSKVVDGKVKIEDLAGKKIGVQKGTTGMYLVADAIEGTSDEAGAHIKGEIEDTNATYTEYSNAIVASNDIGSAIDVVVIDKLPAESIAAGKSTTLQAYALDAEPESYVLYFNKGAQDLVKKVNDILDAMIKGGVIDFYTVKHSGGFTTK